ncbi:hypothetical protein J6590_055947 [Homalodisca vitripennis]|nr:hypothetical protein J6590_045032 [Homalodisca vitripennis]KAG8310870.1 hypothetical protein J6590_055947 [Homalodisca vitripennis]
MSSDIGLDMYNDLNLSGVLLNDHDYYADTCSTMLINHEEEALMDTNSDNNDPDFYRNSNTNVSVENNVLTNHEEETLIDTNSNNSEPSFDPNNHTDTPSENNTFIDHEEEIFMETNNESNDPVFDPTNDAIIENNPQILNVTKPKKTRRKREVTKNKSAREKGKSYCGKRQTDGKWNNKIPREEKKMKSPLKEYVVSADDCVGYLLKSRPTQWTLY